MNKFILQHIVFPYKRNWLVGIALALLWAVSFVMLPAIAGWFLATCAVVFITANTTFSYIFPSTTIRLLAILRSGVKYAEKTENHRTLLQVEQSLQLKIFEKVSRLPFAQKQQQNISSIVHTVVYGIEAVQNYFLLWLIPLFGFVVAFLASVGYLLPMNLGLGLLLLSGGIGIVFLLPALVLRNNDDYTRKIHGLKIKQQAFLTQSFQASIEIAQYQLMDKVVYTAHQDAELILSFEKKLQRQQLLLSFCTGLGFALLSLLLLYFSRNASMDVTLATGIFLGVLSLGELAELFVPTKTRNKALNLNIKAMDELLQAKESPDTDSNRSVPPFESLQLQDWSVKIPNAKLSFPEVSIQLKKQEWLGVFGPTGSGKTTLLNSLFYPEYRQSRGKLLLNNEPIEKLTIPKAIFVAQEAFVLTGTLRENFFGASDDAILNTLQVVGLKTWFQTLLQGLNTWLGEDGQYLSGGQRKKLLLAQALLQSPELLIIDEPTAGIDLVSALEIFNNIRKTYPRLTVLMVTHQIGLKPLFNRMYSIEQEKF